MNSARYFAPIIPFHHHNDALSYMIIFPFYSYLFYFFTYNLNKSHFENSQSLVFGFLNEAEKSEHQC